MILLALAALSTIKMNQLVTFMLNQISISLLAAPAICNCQLSQESTNCDALPRSSANCDALPRNIVFLFNNLPSYIHNYFRILQ